MKYGFVINNDACIGCHACSTACKSENEVPLGVNRTWVKSVETGQYPDVTRSFQVTRCNHCANAPCVSICPVTAMYQREDGIVEFDADICIGCKACMQACPYDAIYMDPDSGTAAKCHYCAHRIDIGLEPACVVVCPAHAILAGDLDDPTTEIAQVLARNKVTVRRPEKGTSPNLFYVGGNDVAMHPGASDRAPDFFAWTDVLPSGGALPTGQPRMAEQMTQVVWNAQHKIPWHWPVPAYLVTKGIAAGMFLILALGSLSGAVATDNHTFMATALVSLIFLIATTALLVVDLERPERFLRIVLKPQWRSWLVRGAFLLIGFSGLVSVWWAGEMAVWMGWVAEADFGFSRDVMIWAGIPLAVGTAIYTAFLFGQADGRDLWQSAILPFHLMVQSFMAGSATLLAMGSMMELSGDLYELVRITFISSLLLDLLFTLSLDWAMTHTSKAALQAAHMITRGRYARSFWGGSVVIGHIIPLGLAFEDLPGSVAGALVLFGLYMYERAFVSAPQEIPNS